VKRSRIQFAPSEPGDLPKGSAVDFLRRTESVHWNLRPLAVSTRKPIVQPAAASPEEWL